MTKGARPFHNKYRRNLKAIPTSTHPDMFNESLDDILPLPNKVTTSTESAPPQQLPHATDTQIEWECAAAAFKQLAFNYSTLLGRTPQDCERDLRRAMEITAKRYPQYRATAFYDDAMRLK